MKQRLSLIAKTEHRSLSAQAELFLVQNVERWETESNAIRNAEAKEAIK